MTTETIRQIARTKTTVAATDSFEGQDGTGSFQVPASGLIGAAVPLPFVGTAPSVGWSRPSLATFSTWLNQNSGVSNAAATDNAGGLPLVLSGNPDSTDYFVTALLKAAPTAPWTIVAGVAMWGLGTAWAYPIVLRDGTSGKMLGFQWTSSMSGESTVAVVEWPDTNHGTQGSNLDDGLRNPPFSDYFLWFKITFDGANFTWSLSPDGRVWGPMNVTGDAGYLATIDQVGFGIERADSSHAHSGQLTEAYAILWQWVET